MPAEWAPHAATWMIWPCREEVWGDRLAETKRGYAAVAHAIARFEPVRMIAPPRLAAEAKSALGGDVEVVEFPVDDSWVRDCGAIFLTDGERLAAANFRFNAWGRKYHPFDADDRIAAAMAEYVGCPLVSSDLIAEGGGISVDGEGTLLTTESCFPNANRNPGWSRARIDGELSRVLGAEKIIWLPGNVEERETDGHVDGIAQFVAPGRVVIEAPAGPGHPWGPIMKANIRALEGKTDAAGRPIEMVRITEAESLRLPRHLEDRFCRSYVNFYLANGAVIAPSYGIREDDQAREILSAACPDREIVMVPIVDVAIGGGGIHCITQQQPAV
ncbi:MAG: agmatine deiminase family protein [Rhizobiales bacterium]|nr:agmatine deiminase family protein [Hyphomicrobiales bacterium]